MILQNIHLHMLVPGKDFHMKQATVTVHPDYTIGEISPRLFGAFLEPIGPVESRKAHLDLAWFQYITNEVSHDEYLQWAEQIGAEPIWTRISA